VRAFKGRSAYPYGLIKAIKKVAGYRSKLERDYAFVLQAMKLSGEIQDWRYEEVTFRLAFDTRYLPDFMVIPQDGAIEFHEVKGLRTQTGRQKFEMAVEKFPWFKWVFVTRDNGAWRFSPHARHYDRRKP